MKARRFSDTWTWWSGTWVAGDEVRFYRPLPSLIWWIEFQISGGLHGAFGFMAVHWLSHFGVCLLLVGFLRRVLGEKIALLSGFAWTTCIAGLLTLPTNYLVLYNWKDGPDVWVTGAILLSLWSLLSYVRTGEKHFLYGAFAAQLVAICTKEMAYVLPLLSLALLWNERKLSHWKIPATMSGITLAAYAFRWHALQGPGFRFGTNGSWLERWVLYVLGGRPFNLAVQGQTAPVAIAVLILGLWLIYQRQFVSGLVGLGVGGAGIAYVGAGETVYRLIAPFVATFPSAVLGLHQDILIVLILLTGWVHFLKHRERRAFLPSRGCCWLTFH